MLILAPGSAQIWRQLLPAFVASALAFLVVGVTVHVDVGEYTAAGALVVAVAAMIVWLPWRRLPRIGRSVPALVFLLSAWLLRDSAGGVNSGVSALALLPVLWIAMHGSPRELAVVLLAVVSYHVAPILLIGGAAYPTSGYRTVVVFVVVSTIVGITVNRLVAQVRGHVGKIESHRRAMEKVAEVSRRIAASRDARGDVCQAAREISGATFAVLLEPDGEGGLASTAMAGLDARPFGSAPAGLPSAPRTALDSRRAVFIADPANSDIVNGDLWVEHGRPASMVFAPVIRGDAVAGVFVVAWAESVEEADGAPIITMLATEAAVAIERADMLEKLSGLALTDPLTGLHNRRSWDSTLPGIIAEARGAGRPLSVAVIDLDHFKAYNDTHGHQQGDRLLQDAAAGWRAVLRPGDLIARYGGEEFAVLLPDSTGVGAVGVVERLRDATPHGQTFSAGVAQWDGIESAHELVGRADAALYGAKAAGRARVRLAVEPPAGG